MGFLEGNLDVLVLLSILPCIVIFSAIKFYLCFRGYEFPDGDRPKSSWAWLLNIFIAYHITAGEQFLMFTPFCAINKKYKSPIIFFSVMQVFEVLLLFSVPIIF